MTLAWVDAGRGASGDMLLGALWDAGADADTVRRSVRAVVPADVVFGHEVRDGFRVARARVVPDAADAGAERSWRAIRAALTRAPLEAGIRERALHVFGLLARAEAGVHGSEVEDAHFHEAGGHDAVADVVGVVAALADLGVDRLACSEIAVGREAGGAAPVAAGHGTLPVPVPAVLALAALAGAPVTAGAVDGEACTPTGMALLAGLVDAWGAVPPLRVARVGAGAGSRPTPGRYGALRVVLGADAALATHPSPEIALVTTTNVDDLDPRLWPRVLAQLLAAGADDAWLTPVLMKKGRPGHTLHALCDPDRADAVRRVVLTETSAIGLRVHAVAKHALPRDEVAVDVAGQRVRVKRASLDGRVVNTQPEWEDVASAAAATGLPAKEVLARAAAAALSAG